MMQEIFNQIDTDRSGEIDAKELGEFMKNFANMMGQKQPSEE